MNTLTINENGRKRFGMSELVSKEYLNDWRIKAIQKANSSKQNKKTLKALKEYRTKNKEANK